MQADPDADCRPVQRTMQVSRGACRGAMQPQVSSAARAEAVHSRRSAVSHGQCSMQRCSACRDAQYAEVQRLALMQWRMPTMHLSPEPWLVQISAGAGQAPIDHQHRALRCSANLIILQYWAVRPIAVHLNSQVQHNYLQTILQQSGAWAQFAVHVAACSHYSSPYSSLQNAECRMPNAECRMPNAECRFQQ